MLIFICVIQTYFRVRTELKVIGHMSDPNSTSSDILSDGPVKDILRPVKARLISVGLVGYLHGTPPLLYTAANVDCFPTLFLNCK